MRKRIFIILPLVALFIGGYFIWRSQQTIDFDLEELHLTLDDEAYEKLEGLRSEALDKGYLERTEDDYVPASIEYLGQELVGKARLKGDWTDHLGDDKWSFRIKLDQPMKDGLQVFSVQNPQCRDQLNAYVYNQLLLDEGVLTNEYRFVELFVNGESWGVYSLEEHLTSRLFQKQERTDGIILKFKDDEYFKYSTNDLEVEGLVQTADIKVYGDSKKKAEVDSLVDEAKQFMKNYQSQVAGNYENFDAQMMGTYYALCDLATAYHAMGWINIRFFYNFESRKMEPIGYDAYPILEWGKPYLGHNASVVDRDPYETEMVVYSALKDSSILSEYHKVLDRVSAEGYAEDFMKRHMTDIQFYEKQIQLEYKDYTYNYDFITDRAKEIRAARAGK